MNARVRTNEGRPFLALQSALRLNRARVGSSTSVLTRHKALGRRPMNVVSTRTIAPRAFSSRLCVTAARDKLVEVWVELRHVLLVIDWLMTAAIDGWHYGLTVALTF